MKRLPHPVDWTHTPARPAAAVALLLLTCVFALATSPQFSAHSMNITPPPTRTIDLNTATQAELELLPRIGPALAQRIITFRTEHSGFTSLEDLDAVPGIGPRTLEDLAPFARFSVLDADSSR